MHLVTSATANCDQYLHYFPTIQRQHLRNAAHSGRQRCYPATPWTRTESPREREALGPQERYGHLRATDKSRCIAARKTASVAIVFNCELRATSRGSHSEIKANPIT